MSVAPLFDDESFQSRLALASTAQETGIEAHSLYRLIQIQRLIASHERDSNDIMQMIAECARDVAHAAGVGISFLEEGQLICRAAVGTSAASIHNLSAVLTPRDNHSRTEILRVENAETDFRIEADICRQLGASALLMLPMYQGHTLAGILAVLFTEAHSFPVREVRTYQLLARLVGESLSTQVEKKVEYEQTGTPSTVAQAILRMTSEMQKRARPQFHREPERKTETGPCEAPAASVRDWSSWSLLRAGTLIRQVFNRPSLNKLHWNPRVVPIVVVLIAVGGWIAYRHGSSSVSHSDVPRVHPAELQVPKSPIAEKQLKVQTGGRHNFSKSAFKRKRVGENEIDYVADDVTIRQFGPVSGPKERRSRNSQVGMRRKSERDGASNRPPDQSR